MGREAGVCRSLARPSTGARGAPGRVLGRIGFDFRGGVPVCCDSQTRVERSERSIATPYPVHVSSTTDDLTHARPRSQCCQMLNEMFMFVESFVEIVS